MVPRSSRSLGNISPPVHEGTDNSGRGKSVGATAPAAAVAPTLLPRPELSVPSCTGGEMLPRLRDERGTIAAVHWTAPGLEANVEWMRSLCSNPGAKGDPPA